jgi:superfamily II DNA or RNA helicase
MNLVEKREGILVAPPGSGKTVMGISILPLLGQPLLWLTHTDRLVKQTAERVDFFLPSLTDEDKGFIGAGKWNLGKLFTIALIQTLIRKPEELYKLRDLYGIVVLDEAHHCPAETFSAVISQLNPYYLYGLTATPYRRDKLEALMFQTLGNKAAVITIDEVVKHGGIIMPKVIYKAIHSKPADTSNTASLMKNYIVPNKKRNGIIVGDVLREALKNNCCIVISDRKAHCEALYELIKMSWEKTGIATGKYSKKHVDEQVKRFEDGEITVLVATFALLGEGFDVDKLNRAFIAMPFRAEAKAEQLLGRIQRIADGKTDAIVFDYVDVDIGVLRSQFFTSSSKDCRWDAYQRLGVEVIPYSNTENIF